QRELRRMQRLPGKAKPVPRTATVDRIADQRMADLLQVDADLVCSAGLEAALEQRRAPEALDDAKGGARRLAAVRDRHAHARARVASERGVDGAACRRVALDHGEVDAAHAAIGELLRER